MQIPAGSRVRLRGYSGSNEYLRNGILGDVVKGGYFSCMVHWDDWVCGHGEDGRIWNVRNDLLELCYEDPSLPDDDISDMVAVLNGARA